MSDLREKLADLAHQQWAGWMKYLFSQCYLHADGTVTIPAELVARWNRQLNTLYEELPEEEKESDRVEADRMLTLMNSERYSGDSVSDTLMIFVALMRQYDVRITELEKKVDELAQQLQPGHR